MGIAMAMVVLVVGLLVAMMVMAMVVSRSIPEAMISKARPRIAAAVSGRGQDASQPREAARQLALWKLCCRPAAQRVAAAQVQSQRLASLAAPVSAFASARLQQPAVASVSVLQLPAAFQRQAARLPPAASAPVLPA
jgi:Na+-transporting methylmalonyl-CoA/oxaloacetate decarboxylase gamma subunit